MKNILNFLTANKYAIIWSICYIFAMWAILDFMFGFSIFNGAQWHKLMRAQLHGFGGFVFGLLILSALPLYIATTTLIIRTKKPLMTLPTLKIKLPKFFIEPKQAAPQIITEQKNDDTITNSPSEQKLPDELPPELYGTFLRARTTIGHNIIIQPNSEPQSSPQTNSDILPLPTDFDIQLDDIPGFDDTPNFSTPVFTDVNFNNTPPQNNSYDSNGINQDIIKHLNQNETTFTIIDDTIITDKYAIITHDDNDFWVTDNENWFATGKTRPSPIKSILKIAQEHNVTPVLYLASTNIMDLEQLIPEWQKNGIIIIRSADEI